MARYFHADYLAKILGEHVGRVVELCEVALPSGTRYLGQQGLTWRGQVYEPLVSTDRGAAIESLGGASDEIRHGLFNVDGSLRDLSEEFDAAVVTTRLVDPDLLNSTTPTYRNANGTVGTATGKTCVVDVVGPEQRDAEFVFTWNNGAGKFDVRSSRAEDLGRVTYVNQATPGTQWISDDGFVKVTITGTYVSGDAGRTWDFRTINSAILFEGPAGRPEDASQRKLDLPIYGFAETMRRAPVPRVQFQVKCQNVYGLTAQRLGVPTLCTGGLDEDGNLEPFTTAVGNSGGGSSPVPSTDLVVASSLKMLSAIGREIFIEIGVDAGGPIGAVVKITAIDEATNHVTLAEPQMWGDGNGITYNECRKTNPDCQDSSRTFQYLGFRGLRTVKGTTQPRGAINTSNGAGTVSLAEWAQQAINASQFGRKTGQLLSAFPVPMPHDALPLIYGYRLAVGIPVEFVDFQDHLNRRFKAVFVAVCVGPLDMAPFSGAFGPLSGFWVNGYAMDHQVKGSAGTYYLNRGFFCRAGDIAIDEFETEVPRYSADSATLFRPQNKDYESQTGNAYNRVAYAMFRAPGDGLVWGDDHRTLPEFIFRVIGRKTTPYSAIGVPGTPAFSALPPFQLLDMLTDWLDGAGMAPMRFRMDRTRAAEDYCAVLIPSVEANTVVTVAGTTSRTITVRSASGFALHQPIYINGVDSGRTVADVLSATKVTVSGTTGLTVAVGDTFQQWNPRFTSDLVIRERASAFSHIDKLTNGCRGYVTMTQGLVAIDVDRETALERMPSTRSLESWASSSNANGWHEKIPSGATVTKDTVIKPDGTTASAKLTTGPGVGHPAEIESDEFQIQSGYGLHSFAFKACAEVDGYQLKVAITNQDDLLELDPATYKWVTIYSGHFFTLTLDTEWRDYSLVIPIDPYLAGTGYTVVFDTGDNMPGSTSLWISTVSFFGRCGGEWRDNGTWRTPQRFLFLKGDEHFKASPPNPDRDINQIDVTIESEFQADIQSATPPIKDEPHQSIHGVNAKTFACPSLKTEDQAVRIGKYQLNRARFLGDGGRWDTGITGLLAAPSDIVLVTARSAGWVRRTMRVLKTSVPPDYKVGIECEHWDPAVYTDEGGPGEFGIGTGFPSIVLLEVARADRRWELAWEVTSAGSPVLRYDVYVAAAVIDPESPDNDFLVGDTVRRSFTYLIPRDLVNVGLEALVVAVMKDGTKAVSNLLDNGTPGLGEIDSPDTSSTAKFKDFTAANPWIWPAAGAGGHGLGATGLRVQAWDNGALDGQRRPLGGLLSVNATTGDIRVDYEAPESGRLVAGL